MHIWKSRFTSFLFSGLSSRLKIKTEPLALVEVDSNMRLIMGFLQ